MPEGWFEVWWDYSSRPPSLLVLLGGGAPDSFEIYDPRVKETVFKARSYEEAMYWLTEDEYSKVDGRMSLDE